MSNYFSYLPNVEYISRIPGDQRINSYVEVKNLFKRVQLSSDIFQDITNFTKYNIQGDERPDNVAYRIYDDPTLDWIVLLSNNIINIQDEWPMTDLVFEKYMNRKYGVTGYDNIHHYETKEVKASDETTIILKKGLEVPSDFSFTYYDEDTDLNTTITDTNTGVTNYQYEQRIQDEKRSIFLMRPQLIATAVADIKRLIGTAPIPRSQDISIY